MIITVDTGSTNMRCRLFDGNTLLDEARRKVGVRNTAFDGNNQKLKDGLRELCQELLERNGISEADVEVIISVGTLASDVGIYHVPHVLVPIGYRESAHYAKMVTLPEITNIPILFVPGIKTMPQGGESPLEAVAIADSLSGEECKTYGVLEQLGIKGDVVVSLPGSYNKVLQVDQDGRITFFKTGMCGEFLTSVGEHTLLNHSLPHPIISRIIPEKLCMGFDHAAEYGISPTLIKARVTRVFMDWNADDSANFYVGGALYDDVRLVIRAHKEGQRLLIGGGNPLRHIFVLLLQHAGIRDVIEITDECARLAPAIGAMKVYRAYLEQNQKVSV